MGRGGNVCHVYVLLPESQGDASINKKGNIHLLGDLGNGAANLRDKGRDLQG
jgi:hypothetical protein